jgi:hypothetical protein
MADCDSTVCAELQRERRKYGTAYIKKKQMNVRIRIQQRKDYEKRIYVRKKLQIKLSPCSIRHHVMTVNGGVEM